MLFLAYFPASNKKFKPGFFQALKPITQKTTSRSFAMIVGLVKLFEVLAVEVYDFRTSLKPSWCSAGFPQYLQHLKMSGAVIGN